MRPSWGMVALVGLALASCEGACAACEGNVESHVDAPTTTGELETWAEERGLTAEIGMVEKDGAGNVACGHSAACVILLPILLADAVLPPTLKRGSVVDEDGVVLYAGIFDLRGRLIRARVRDGDELREIVRLELEELGERPIVERTRIQVDAEGQETGRTPTPIVPQVDLPAMYGAALADEGDGDDRADLVNEALDELGEELLPAMLERYESLAAIDDEELSGVMERRCADDAAVGRAELTELAVERGGPQTAMATAPCASEAQAQALVGRVAAFGCEVTRAREVNAAREALGQLAAKAEAATREAARGCGDEVRRTVLRLAAGERASDAALVRAIREDVAGAAVVGALSPRLPENRSVIVAALDGARGPTLAIAKALSDGTTGSPSVDEARRAAEVYAGDITDDAPNTRHYLLKWLSRADPAPRAAAAEVLRAVRPSAPHVEAALVMVAGEHQRLAKAVEGLDPGRVGSHSYGSPLDLYNDDMVIGFALMEAGCTKHEVGEAARAAGRGEAVPACAGF